MTVSKFMSLTAVATMVVASLGVAAPAAARDHGYDRDNGRYDRSYQDYRRGDRGRDYRAYNYRSNARDNYRYRDNYRCRDNGTGGTIIGAIAGGLIGHEVAGRRGDKTAGVLLGGAVGAVAGRAIDKSDSRC